MGSGRNSRTAQPSRDGRDSERARVKLLPLFVMRRPVPIIIGTTHKYVRASRRVFFAELLLFTSPLVLAMNLDAQRALEVHGNVIYEDVGKHKINLGKGFSPVLTADGKVAFLRGRKFYYGELFDCSHAEGKNWIVLYDPATMREKTIFNRSLDYDGRGLYFCIFEQMQLSRDGSVLYLVSPIYATSGSLAILNLAGGSVVYVPGVMSVYVIENGPHRDELIYVRRMFHTAGHDVESPTYPFITLGRMVNKLQKSRTNFLPSEETIRSLFYESTFVASVG